KYNIKIAILRLPLVVGANPPGNPGAMIAGIKSVRYFRIGKAAPKKSMIWGADIVEILPALIEKGDVYNLTDGHHPTFGELEATIAAALNKKKPKKIPILLAQAIGFIGNLLGPKSPLSSDKIKKIIKPLTFDDGKARANLNW